MDIKAIFRCTDFENKIIMQCRSNEKISTVLDRFSQKLFAEKKDYKFFYDSKEINIKDKESTMMNLINDKTIKEIEIIFKKRSKIIKCPQCICNNCILKIDKYRLYFSHCCKRVHTNTKLFQDYEDTQRINYKNIKCFLCKKTQKDKLEEFHKCLNCTNLAKFTEYYCNECNTTHINKTKHKTIKYDEKYFYCSKHFSEFISYCSKCNYNLCKACEENHKDHKDNRDHKIIKFDALKPDLDSIKNNLEEIGEKIEDLKIIVEIIKTQMDDAIKIIENYYDIANDIVSKYETFNSKSNNYQTLLTVNYLSSSNKEILNQIKNIINGNERKEDWLNKFSVLLDITESDRSDYNNKINESSDKISTISNSESKNDIDEINDFNIKREENYIQTNNESTNSVRKSNKSKNKKCLKKPKSGKKNMDSE